MSFFSDFLNKWFARNQPVPEPDNKDLTYYKERRRLWQEQFEARRRARPHGLQLTLALERNLDDPIALSPKRDFITSGAKDATIRLWNPQTGAEVKRLQAHDRRVSSVAWAPSGRLVSGANDTTICLWDVRIEEMQTGDVNIEKAKLTLAGHSRAVTSVAWSPKGDFLASGGEDKTVRIWDTLTNAAPRVLLGHSRSVRVVAWSADGQFLASAGDGGNVHIWDAQRGAVVRVINANASGVLCIAWSPSPREKHLLASGGNDATVRIWDVRTGHPVRFLEEHTQRVTGVSFSPDGRLLASQSVLEGAEVCFWRVDTWELVAKLPINPFRMSYPLAFQRDTPVLLTGGDKTEDEIRVWNVDVDALIQGTPPSMQYSNAKVVLMGDTSVGKTGLFTVLSGENFKASESTHGRHVHVLESRDVAINEQGQEDPFGTRRERREILLWDLAGQPSYRVIHQLHLNEVAVALIVFDGSNETDPFAGVRYWDRALRQAQFAAGQDPFPMKKYLVAARVDRGGIGVSKDRIDQLVKEMGFAGYIETSAKAGTNIAELRKLIKTSIEWETLLHVTSNEIFEKIKSFLLQPRRAEQILSYKFELYNTLRNQGGLDGENLFAQFERCIIQLEARNLVRRLGIGNFLLLQPELLDAYASGLVNSVREEPDGLGKILESDVKECRFQMPEDARVKDKAQEEILLLAMIQDLLRHELALREETHEGTFLVFPSQSTRVNYDLPDPKGKALVFQFEGSTQNIYATLAVRLSSSQLFLKKELWKDAITYTAIAGGIVGMFLQGLGEGRGRLTLFYDEQTTEQTRFHFENFVEHHLLRRAVPGSVQRTRLFTCPEPTCREPVSPNSVEKRRQRGLNWLICPICETRVELADREERFAATPTSHLLEMDSAADSRRILSALKATRQQEKEIAVYQNQKLEDFDVYLCYSEADRAAVKQVASQLLDMNVIPWLDEWESKPGENWQPQLDLQMPSIGAVAVFIGNERTPWQDEVQEKYLRSFAVKRAVVPVILPETQNKPSLPEYIASEWVDMRIIEPDPIQHLIASIRVK